MQTTALNLIRSIGLSLQILIMGMSKFTQKTRKGKQETGERGGGGAGENEQNWREEALPFQAPRRTATVQAYTHIRTPIGLLMVTISLMSGMNKTGGRKHCPPKLPVEPLLCWHIHTYAHL